MAGLEPSTNRLTVCYSTIELHTDIVSQVGFEPTSLPHGTCFTDKRAHQLLNWLILCGLGELRYLDLLFNRQLLFPWATNPFVEPLGYAPSPAVFQTAASTKLAWAPYLWIHWGFEPQTPECKSGVIAVFTNDPFLLDWIDLNPMSIRCFGCFTLP